MRHISALRLSAVALITVTLTACAHARGQVPRTESTDIVRVQPEDHVSNHARETQPETRDIPGSPCGRHEGPR